MSFFDRGNTTYVDATLGWKFPTRESLKALFSKYMPQWPAGARSYQTEVLGDAQGAVVFFTNTPQEFGHEIRGIAVVDIRNGKFVRWVDYWDGRHFGVSATESLRTPPACTRPSWAASRSRPTSRGPCPHSPTARAHKCATSSEERPAEVTNGRTRAPRPREASTRSSSIPGDRSCS